MVFCTEQKTCMEFFGSQTAVLKESLNNGDQARDCRHFIAPGPVVAIAEVEVMVVTIVVV